MIWWLVAAFIGAIGVANGILNRLKTKAAKERKRWADQHQSVQRQINSYDQQINQKIRVAQGIADFHTLTNLHFESMKIADHAYKLLTDSRTALNAIGEAIVETAKEKDAMISKKRGSWGYYNKEKYEQEIVALKQLRDHLTSDKNELKRQRDQFYEQVKTFNSRTHSLKIVIKDRCGVKGKDWYTRLEARSMARKKGLPVPKNTSKDRKSLPQPRVHGIVKFYDGNKGFGFITPLAGGPDIHVSKKNLHGITKLRDGERVSFAKMKGDKGPWAKDVKRG